MKWRLPFQARKLSRVQYFPHLQSFATFAELEAKVMAQGEVSLQRIEPYRGQNNFSIPMSYDLALMAG